MLNPFILGSDPALDNQPVVISFGESTSGMNGARSLVSDLVYTYPTDSDIMIWDAAQLLSSGVGIKTLKLPSIGTVTIDIGTGVITHTAHGGSNGDPAVLYSTGGLPTGFTAATTRYYMVNATANTYQLAATRGGPPLALSGTQSGTHSAVLNGGHAQQPGGAAYVDPDWPASPGDAGELGRILRTGMSGRVDHFCNQRGGASFDDTNATFGRAVNYDVAFNDGAADEMLTQWQAYEAALAAEGKQPQPLGVFITLGSNTIIHGPPYIAPFQGKMEALLAWGAANIWGNAPVYLCRPGLQQSGLDPTNRATIRSQMAAIATADPQVSLIDMDGMICTADTVHPDAPSYTIRGGNEALEILGQWYPAKNIQAMGAVHPPLRQWHFNAQTNSIISGQVASTRDRIGNASTLVGASGERPAVATRTLTNGLLARYASFDGTNDNVRGANPVAYNNPGGFILFFAARVPSSNDRVLYSEGNNTDSNPIWGLKTITGGDIAFIVRDNAGTLAGPTALGMGGADGTWRRFMFTFDEAAVTGYNNGVAGSTPVAHTRGTLTLNNACIGAHNVGGALIHFFNGDIGGLDIMQYSATGLAQTLADIDAYLQRHWVN